MQVFKRTGRIIRKQDLDSMNILQEVYPYNSDNHEAQQATDFEKHM